MGSNTNRWTKKRAIDWFKENRPFWKLNIKKLPDKITTKTKVEYECLLCNRVNTQSIKNIAYGGKGCIRCAGMEPWTKTRLINWFNENKPDCKLNVDKLPEKITSKTKVEYECLTCNYVSNQSIDTIVNRGYCCVKCSGNEPWTKQRLIVWFKENKSNWRLNIDKLPEKVGAYTKVEYECLLCSYVNNQSISAIVNQGCGCLRCTGKEPWNKTRLIDWFKENKPDCKLNVEKLPEKIVTDTQVEYECLLCSYVNNQSIQVIFYHGCGCVRCSRKEPWTKQRLINWYSKKPGWILFHQDLPERLSAFTKVSSQCPDCGHINNQSINTIVNQGTRCVKCGPSLGHKLTASILDKLKISYLEEWLSSNLKPNTRYRFDFSLPQYNVIIEFHGEQHYEPRNFGSKSETAEEKFIYTKKTIKQNAKSSKTLVGVI